jgi:uroporphyrinogen-III synthase
MIKILLTRPKKLSQTIAQNPTKKNLSFLIQPLFSVVPTDNFQPINQKLQAVLITSVAAVFALEKFEIKKDILVLAVGKKTADAIKKLGYQNVLSANNSAASLLDLALEKLSKNNAKEKNLVVYLAGEKITLDLAAKLSEQNFNAKKIVVYKTVEVKKFSHTTISGIKNGDIDEIWIYSKNSLEIFYKLAQKHNLLECLSQIKILCLSKKIAELAKKIGFIKIGVFEN